MKTRVLHPVARTVAATVAHPAFFRATVFLAMAVVLLTVAATPGFCARLNPQPLPPRYAGFSAMFGPIQHFFQGLAVYLTPHLPSH